jgi:hypothetical protein
VNRTKDQIKNAPEFDDSLSRDAGYRRELGSYYGRGGQGYRDWDDSASHDWVGDLFRTARLAA